jgi:hypothetical protein
MNKLEENGLRQSKFILPEHKEAMLRQQREDKRKARPYLDDLEIAAINTVLTQSEAHRCHIKIKLFDPFEPRELIGVVVAEYNPALRNVKFNVDGEIEWISVSQIMSAEIVEGEVMLIWV